MGCVLRVSGTAEAVRRFVERGFIEPCAVFEESLNISVSDADFGDLPRQIEDAIAFLEGAGEQLLEMCQAFGFDDWRLDFGVRQVPDMFAWGFTFPCELLLLAGQCHMDIEVSVYASSGPEGEADERL